ncbi:glycosyltransferase [Synechococcus sp. J7-Johnson]|uniref:glycosyltransferase n=1 Tax=Synechococcus sp. J7-Johnson TaxID=2823737 RepID=UPI0020CD7031|nr:glycosyltransferase [Synechococcus sp. J7-Johnson]MCP9841884.1 glycosyltransferase [Synechococcus sp. J7-Johnson]
MTLSLLIVVPTRNSSQLLPRLLNSLHSQSWPHWRLLFIDGSSAPEHRQWLQQCCATDLRCRWIPQSPDEPGIFGAMNQGFAAASFTDWLLFWGSDDWAATPSVLAKAVAVLEHAISGSGLPDLLVCRGHYVDAGSGVLGRPTAFSGSSAKQLLLPAADYRRALWLGSTPPHQATWIGPGARRHLARYAPGFRLSADLDFFLQLSRDPDLRVQLLDLDLVHMADGGISGQQTSRRLQEVCRAYLRAFGWCWWIPFLARYLRRISSLLSR